MKPRNIVRGVTSPNPVVSRWVASTDIDSDSGDEVYNREGYFACMEEDDICIVVSQSPYYTFCRPCSSCYPNSGDLESPDGMGRETFCFGPDWFENGECGPYPVFRVYDGEPVWRTDAEKWLWQGVLEGLAFTCLGEEDEEKPEVNAGDVWSLLDDSERFEIVSDVMNFYHEIRDRVLPWGENGPDGEFWEKVGINFHFTRNGHGAGFWNLGWDDIGDILTKISKPYSTCELTVWVDEVSGDLRGEIHH